ncbi:MAG TPA: hypothetical protein VI386_22230 [Candidatus Sulfotelmatobacter sp.]
MPSKVASFASTLPHVTIRVSGQLFRAHLNYLDQLIQSAIECQLWPLLDVTHLVELDRTALFYLIRGEEREFSLVACPNFVREWIDYEKERKAA